MGFGISNNAVNASFGMGAHAREAQKKYDQSSLNNRLEYRTWISGLDWIQEDGFWATIPESHYCRSSNHCLIV